MSWIFITLIGIGIIIFVKKMFSFENLQDLGIKRYREGNFSESITYLEKAIKKRPNHPETICALGESYLQQSLKVESISLSASKIYQSKAILNFKKYLQLEPNGYHKTQIIQKLEYIKLHK
ncbi:hypothetical protein TD3509T_320008 [Tenacibaculum dicentrarchi]|uniref:Tetratricopeptide repeat protein n=1 Tax=Tenacibaculum dicentrarchi TaxID=669041 RepID=A0ABM9NXI1_9FLAO|nr:hypothetical protein TD3509T_320008 [Tenacibaculum dicentrarchi]